MSWPSGQRGSRLIRLTMKYCFNVYRRLSASLTLPTCGSGRICLVRPSTSTTYLVCGVPQGSVLGLVLFFLYTADLVSLIESHSLSPHLYADDTQVYGSCSPAAVDALSVTISECSADVTSWMRSNRLQLNSDNTEVMWCTTDRRQHQLPTATLPINGVPVAPVSSVCDLGIYIDADLVMWTHVKKIASRCFAVLRQLRQIRRYVSTDTFRALVVALVVTRLDYGNAVLTGLPVYLSRRLQSVLNAAAWLIFGLRRSDHVSDALISLHWLHIPQRIQFKVAVLTYKVLDGCAPSYLGPFVHVADLPSRRALRSANTSRLIQPQCNQSTVGDKACPVAGPQAWNSLPPEVTSTPSLVTFRRRLKTHLFTMSYSNIQLS